MHPDDELRIDHRLWHRQLPKDPLRTHLQQALPDRVDDSYSNIHNAEQEILRKQPLPERKLSLHHPLY